jgi:hypothetical protein
MSNIATNGTNVVASGTYNSASAVQYSTNYGVTWSAATTPASSYASTFAWTGTNFVSTHASGTPMYSPTGAVWTAATGAGTPGGSSAGSVIASNGAGTVLTCNGTGTTLYISTNNGVSYSASTTAAGIAVAPNNPIVWTGSAWLIFGNGTLQLSTTGATGSWSSTVALPWYGQQPAGAISDGAGNVLVVFSDSSIAYASGNGGSTWRPTFLPGLAAGASCANGRWIVPLTTSYTAGDMAISSDLYSWIHVPSFAVPANAGVSTNGAAAVVFAGGNYIAVGADSATAAATATENTANMYLPLTNKTAIISPGTTTSQSVVWQDWIKVQ